MNSRQLFALLRAKFGSMLVLGLFLAAISFVGLIFFEKPYQSSMDFLVVQTNGQTKDFYTQFKSSEYLGKVLSEAIFSERFINAVVETGKVNTEFLPFDKKDRLKTWSQTVFVKNNLELGIISVTEKSVDIRILSGPILERNPTTSEIFKVVLGGFFAGLFLTGVWLIVRNENFLTNKEAT